MTTPSTTFCVWLVTSVRFMAFWITAMRNAPTRAPVIRPSPPDRLAPPTTAAMTNNLGHHAVARRPRFCSATTDFSGRKA
jgi:hypothetical protein